ncbi:MAG: hypothetical protein OEY29_14515, partial [Gammaproteobacteria bacterium]|nr:hypothetical protein [Gammaproteobacteria bacterium]
MVLLPRKSSTDFEESWQLAVGSWQLAVGIKFYFFETNYQLFLYILYDFTANRTLTTANFLST